MIVAGTELELPGAVWVLTAPVFIAAMTLASPGLYAAAAAVGVLAVVMGTRFGRFPWRRRPSAGE